MKETFVTIEQAQALKRLGFDWGNGWYYINNDLVHLAEGFVGYEYYKNWDKRILAPEPHIVQGWLREVKGIAVNVAAHDGGLYDWDIVFLPNADEGLEVCNRSTWCKTYEEALSEGIDEALKMLEGKI